MQQFQTSNEVISVPRKRMTIVNELFNKPFPSALRELMRERNATQQELAKELGKTRQSISYYCDGSSSPDWETIAKIAKAYSVSSDWLLGLSDVKTPHTDIKAVCEFTGLSEQAVTSLKAYSKKSVSFISEFLEKAEITHIALLYENLKRSRKKLHTYEQICSGIDNSSTTAAGLDMMKKLHDAKEKAEFDRWKLERSIMTILDKMMEGK